MLLRQARLPGITCAGYAQQYAHLAQQHQKTVGEKRQTDAGIGQQRRADADVQKHLPRHLRDNADAQQGTVQIRRTQRNKDALHHQRRK